METLDPLSGLDWTVIALFFGATLAIGLYFSKRATGSLSEYFVAGRKMTWWLAGTSIVATSFAADTPLVISGWMRTIGLERNWFWWGGIMGMMLCTFFFARLWRRADILTDVEFNELRYSGAPAASLRAFHATYRSLIQNTLVMGWVTLAMSKIIDVTLDIPSLVFLKSQFLPHLVPKGVEIAAAVGLDNISDWPVMGAAIIPPKATAIIACMSIAALYSAVSGLWGVIATDFFQFTFAMTGTIILMVVVLAASGGPTSMVTQANEAVLSGRVFNRAPGDRRAFPLDKWKKDKAKKNSEPQADLDKLVAAKLIQPAEGGEAYVWTSDGLTQSAFAARVGEAGVQASKAAMHHWKKAYTVPRSHFVDAKSLDEAVASALLTEGESGTKKTSDYLRFATLSHSEETLKNALQEANVHNHSAVLSAWRQDKVVVPAKITGFLPPFDLEGGGLLAVWALVVFLGLQWWVGGEGGGFLAQRLFSCKDEKHSVLAMLWFNFANFVLRPWPWIVVGVASLFLIPDVTVYGKGYDPEHAYALMLMKYLPAGFKGLMVAALMAAYMSTISTHVNFGASYIVNDLYRRFVNKGGTEKANVLVSQVASVLLAMLAALYAFLSDSIGSGWFTFFELMSGAGIVTLLRWYWWRINAWSELSAMVSSLVVFTELNHGFVVRGLFSSAGAPGYLLDEYAVRFTINLLFSTGVWVTVTFLTQPEKEDHLVEFYRRIRPAGWWAPIAAKAGNPDHLVVGRTEWAAWAFGVTGLFSMIAAFGKLCFGEFLISGLCAAYGVFATLCLFRLLKRMDWSSLREEKEDKQPQENDVSTPSMGIPSGVGDGVCS